ncbi:hypothetical protein ACXN5S_05740 [Pseudoroseicyclus sp. H15]
MTAELHVYLSGLSAVLFGAVLAGVYTSYLNHLSETNSVIRDYISELERIERLVEEYWLGATYAHSEEQHRDVGHILLAAVEATGLYAETTVQILGDLYLEFEGLDLELYMSATGGEFQTTEYKASPDRYAECVNIIVRMKAILRKKRTKMFWAR